MRKLPNIFIYCCLVTMFFQGDLLLAQESASKIKEEETIILSSKMVENGAQLKEYELKPIFKSLSPWNREGLFKVGYRPSVKSTPGNDFFTEMSHVFSVRYEKKVFLPVLSLALETGLRLQDVGDASYDYRQETPGQEVAIRYFEGTWKNGNYYTNFFNADLSLRYYYNQTERLKVGASGNNFAQSFLQLKVKDLLTYARRRTFEISQTGEQGRRVTQLERITDKNMWTLQPAYFMVGWGVQRQIYGKLWLEFQLGGGTRIPGSTRLVHLDNDFVYEANLMIGLALGKKKELQ